MANVQFDLVSPERRLASVEATEVQIPGADGDMTAMANHAPTITTLRPGVLRVLHAGGTDEYVVSGGFAEITATTVSVLAEQALPRAEMTQEVFDEMLSEAKEAYNSAKEGFKNEPGPVDDAAKLSIKLLGKKYLNNIYNITGKKRIVISVLLKNLKKLYGLKKKPVFLNIKDRNHYTHTPYTMKPKKHFTFKEKNEKNFYNELLKLYKYL